MGHSSECVWTDQKINSNCIEMNEMTEMNEKVQKKVLFLIEMPYPDN